MHSNCGGKYRVETIPNIETNLNEQQQNLTDKSQNVIQMHHYYLLKMVVQKPTK